MVDSNAPGRACRTTETRRRLPGRRVMSRIGQPARARRLSGFLVWGRALRQPSSPSSGPAGPRHAIRPLSVSQVRIEPGSVHTTAPATSAPRHRSTTLTVDDRAKPGVGLGSACDRSAMSQTVCPIHAPTLLGDHSLYTSRSAVSISSGLAPSDLFRNPMSLVWVRSCGVPGTLDDGFFRKTLGDQQPCDRRRRTVLSLLIEWSPPPAEFESGNDVLRSAPVGPQHIVWQSRSQRLRL